MENKEKSAALLHPANTKVAAQIIENEQATDWTPCQVCGEEYRRAILKNSLCPFCRRKEEERQQRMADSARLLRIALRSDDGLIEIAGRRFIETSENSRAYQVAQAFDPAGDNLFLFSRPTVDGAGRIIYTGAGTGKTMLAVKILRRAVYAGLDGVFVMPRKWLRSLYGVKGAEQQAAIDRLVSASVLVLDETGMEPITPSGFSIAELYEVINERWLKKRNGLVITSNKSLGELAEYWNDDRVTSRIAGMCNVVEVSGRDWRQPE